MNIKFDGKYKSINRIVWNDIPILSVITGKNGTGKSQLLDIIKSGILKSWENTPNPPSIFAQLSGVLYRTEDLVFLRGEWGLSNLEAIGLNNVQQERESLYNQFTNRHKQLRGVNAVNIRKQREQYRKQPKHNSLIEFFDEVIEDNKLFNGQTLPKDEFLNLIPNNFLTDIRLQATNSNIGKIFYNYRLDLIEAKSNGISEEEFIKEHSEKPWVLINQLFNDIELPFELNNPEEVNMRDMYTPVLKNKNTREPINFTDLSSGEKVLVSLVFWLFNTNDSGVFPKILLLDEPDAHLHPSMTKQFLFVLKNVLCDKYGVRVIMTTHSPSTVALAPEDSLYLMKRDGERIGKAIKDSALSILTAGVPSFSINYENRRQVFVESLYDVIFYEKLYQKLSVHLIPEISLAFISSGDSRTDKNGVKVANCDQVINICKTLRNAGNNFIWGIIDWDTTNEPNTHEFIKVLGDKNRYAIENYLFDPLLLGAMLLREKLITKIELGLNEHECFNDFKKFPKEKLQVIANVIVNLVAEKVNPNEGLENEKVTYVNGIRIEIPRWYLILHGHTLEEKILETFPSLSKLKRGKEELLKYEIIDKIIDDIPDLIPQDILDAFKYVQE
ncbi:AAA family ATPase [Aquimarina rhabdastrellae]